MNDKLPPHLGGHFGVTHIDRGALEWLISLGQRSVLDIGCGPGGQVKQARNLEMFATGIDGDPSCSPDLLHDFCEGPLSGSRYDAVWCVEFLEHIAIQYLDNVLETILKTNPNIIVASAAPPGFSGFHHVNCQSEEFWFREFRKIGFYFDEELTYQLRHFSTMKREFIPKRGWALIKEKL